MSCLDQTSQSFGDAVSPRSGRRIERYFLESINEFAECILGPNSNLCPGLHPKIQEEIRLVDEKPLQPLISPRQTSIETNSEPIAVKTTCQELATVLGKVVDLVIKATKEGSTQYDCSALNELMRNQQLEKRDDFSEDEMLCLTYKELNKVVLQIVKSSKECVEKKTLKPTGICISNFGSKKSTVDLHWGSHQVSRYLSPSMDPGQEMSVECFSL